MKKLGIFVICGLLAGALLLSVSQRRQQTYQRTPVDYQIPAVTLTNQLGQPIELRAWLQSKKAVMLEFSYTSCTTLCADQAIKFVNLQHRKEYNPEGATLVSISIDPQFDTPQVLKDYLTRFQARPGWNYLTGSNADIRQVMQAFDISPTDMVTLKSALLLYRAGANHWIRIDGRLSTADLYREYLALIEPR